MTAELAGYPTVGDLAAGRMVIAGCSRRKAATRVPVAALNLYEGGSIPWLRARVGALPELRARVRIVSAEHGLLRPDTPLLPYDRLLDPARATQLRSFVREALAREWASGGVPAEILVIAEPLYLVPLADILATAVRVHWIPDPYDRAGAARVLDQWGWP
jgi:hypothetical protein